MVQRGDRARFALEALGELLGRNLDGDVAAQARVVRAVHLAHAARADLGQDLVRAEALTGR